MDLKNKAVNLHMCATYLQDVELFSVNVISTKLKMFFILQTVSHSFGNPTSHIAVVNGRRLLDGFHCVLAGCEMASGNIYISFCFLF